MRVLRKLAALFRRQRLEADMAEEMRLHLEQRTRENVAAGKSLEDARYAAHRKFGGVEQAKELARDQWSWRWLEQSWRDIRFSARSLRKAPGFSLAVIGTLALSIGANTAIVSALNSLILQPLPFREPQQVVEVYNALPGSGQPKNFISLAQYFDFRENADLFSGFGLAVIFPVTIGEDSAPERINTQRATIDFFRVFDVTPLHGRFFAPGDDEPGQNQVVVLTQSFWENYYHADVSLVGRQIRLSGEMFTVIGIAPRSVEAIDARSKIYTPYPIPRPANMPPGQSFSSLIQRSPQVRYQPAGVMFARLKPGVALGAGLAQLDTLEKRFYQDVANQAARDYVDRSGARVGMGRVKDEHLRSFKTGLFVLQGGVLFVLLIGCVNVANLMLVRCNSRISELALQQALGAGRVALIRQVLIEALLLAGSGALAGLFLAWAGVRVLNTYLLEIVIETSPVALDANILGLTLAVSVAVALLIGLLPVLRLWRLESASANLLVVMQRGSRGSSKGRTTSSVLVVGQLAVALTLLIGAGLLIRSFAKVLALDPGFAARQVVTGRVLLSAAYQNAEKITSFHDLLMMKMREVPGVEAVALSALAIVESTAMPAATYAIRGREATETPPMAYPIPVTPGFFAAMGMRVVEGRDFTPDDRGPMDRPQPARVAIVDRNFAERYFPGRSALGESVGQGVNPPPNAPRLTVIGVVEPARLHGLEDSSGVPYLYTPLGPSRTVSLAVRTGRPAADVIQAMRIVVRTIDPTLPLYFTESLQDTLDRRMSNRRGVTLLLGIFAGLALLLAAVGIYGLLAYDVTQRTREIGIRGAIGASRQQILMMILRQGLGKGLIGLSIGLVTAYFLTRFMRGLLYEVQPADPLAYFGVSLLLLAVAMIASYMPARRAANVNPVTALRCDASSPNANVSCSAVHRRTAREVRVCTDAFTFRAS